MTMVMLLYRSARRVHTLTQMHARTYTHARERACTHTGTQPDTGANSTYTFFWDFSIYAEFSYFKATKH